MISYDDFHKVEMHIGTITEASPFPKARKPAYILVIDFGTEIGFKKTSAQITDFYQVEDLVGQQIIAVTNFPPKQIGPIMSEVLVLAGLSDSGQATLVQPERACSNGTRIF